MKKTILLLLLVCCSVLGAQAQFFRLGAKAGGGVSGAVGEHAPSSQTNYYASMHVGLIGTYDFVSPVSLQSELLFTKKGFTYNAYAVNPTEAYSGDLRFNYLELPVLLKLRSGGLFAEAGPYVGYLLSINSDVNRIDSSTSGNDTPLVLGPQEFSRSEFQAFDYGYAIGGGLALDNGFFLSLRHSGGLRSFSGQGLTMRNAVWQISIGYILPADM